ncbi:MAG: PAS domain S-box protein [Acidobacteriia bacterium]|nr:PAS domain S-box protein [Terriglobia bacterium]
MSQLTLYGPLLDAAPDGMILVDRDGQIVLVNAQTEILFGYGREELLGHDLEILTPERFRGRHAKHRTNYFGQPKLRTMGTGLELYGRRKDNTEFPAEISLSPLETDGETLALAAIRDITERKGMHDTIRESEERFRVALKLSPVVVFNQDLELRYTWINSPVLAWANQDYIGRTDAEIVSGEEGAFLTAFKQGVLDSGTGARTECAVTFMGQTRHFDLTAEPLRDSRGTLVGITCACTDVTPTKQAATERERLIAELQDALAKVKLLSGLLPICASCKRIRDEHGSWHQLELYIGAHSEAAFSHGLCTECVREMDSDHLLC